MHPKRRVWPNAGQTRQNRPDGGIMINGLLFWLIFLFVIYVAYVLGLHSAMARAVAAAVRR